MGFNTFLARKQPADGNARAQARSGTGNLGYALRAYKKKRCRGLSILRSDII
jgi:hypothetical protein